MNMNAGSYYVISTTFHRRHVVGCGNRCHSAGRARIVAGQPAAYDSRPLPGQLRVDGAAGSADIPPAWLAENFLAWCCDLADASHADSGSVLVRPLQHRVS